MSVSITLLIITLLVTLVNVWKSFKRDSIRKDIFINASLTLLAVLAFSFSWWNQNEDKKKSEARHIADQEALQLQRNTFNATQRLEYLTAYVNNTMSMVKKQADSITQREIEISQTSQNNFLINYAKQKELLTIATELQYPLQKEIHVSFTLSFEDNLLTYVFDRMSCKNNFPLKNVIYSCSGGNVFRMGTFTDSFCNMLKHNFFTRFDNFLFSLAFTCKGNNGKNYDIRYISSFNLQEPPDGAILRVERDKINNKKVFLVTAYNLPMNINYNNISSVKQLSGAHVKVVNSFVGLLNDHHPEGAKYEELIVDFGNIQASKLLPIGFPEAYIDNFQLDTIAGKNSH